MSICICKFDEIKDGIANEMSIVVKRADFLQSEFLYMQGDKEIVNRESVPLAPTNLEKPHV